jgi:hypothetical protein
VDLIIDGFDNKTATGNAVLELISGAQFQFFHQLGGYGDQRKAVTYFRFLHVTRSFRI